MATSIKLSKITKVDLRDCWQNEANDFTPWLATEENISLLADALGMNELELTEGLSPCELKICPNDKYYVEGRFILIIDELLDEWEQKSPSAEVVKTDIEAN
jgi:hypothetical protein